MVDVSWFATRIQRAHTFIWISQCSRCGPTHWRTTHEAIRSAETSHACVLEFLLPSRDGPAQHPSHISERRQRKLQASINFLAVMSTSWDSTHRQGAGRLGATSRREWVPARLWRCPPRASPAGPRPAGACASGLGAGHAILFHTSKPKDSGGLFQSRNASRC
jgi:hypothetical protein